MTGNFKKVIKKSFSNQPSPKVGPRGKKRKKENESSSKERRSNLNPQVLPTFPHFQCWIALFSLRLLLLISCSGFCFEGDKKNRHPVLTHVKRRDQVYSCMQTKLFPITAVPHLYMFGWNEAPIYKYIRLKQCILLLVVIQIKGLFVNI